LWQVAGAPHLLPFPPEVDRHEIKIQSVPTPAASHPFADISLNPMKSLSLALCLVLHLPLAASTLPIEVDPATPLGGTNATIPKNGAFHTCRIDVGPEPWWRATLREVWQETRAGEFAMMTLDRLTPTTSLKDIVGYCARRGATIDHAHQAAIKNKRYLSVAGAPDVFHYGVLSGNAMVDGDYMFNNALSGGVTFGHPPFIGIRSFISPILFVTAA
jgi:hypothetical protein